MLKTSLTRTSFDSTALAGLASIAHPVREPGHWRLEAHGRGTGIWSVDIIVREGGSPRVAVDLASSARDDSCCAATDLVLAVSGMINLNASIAREGSFGLLYRGRETEPVWDSRALEPGDHYACMPIRPGTYRVSNLLGDARASVRVAYPDPRYIAEGRRLSSGPVQLKVGRTIKPRTLKIDPGQPLVFAIEVLSRLALELTEPDDGSPDLAEWRAARNRDCLNSAFGLTRQRGSTT